MIEQKIEAARSLALDVVLLLSLKERTQSHRVPNGFAHDHSRSRLGQDEPTFSSAKLAFERWVPLDLDWVSVVNSKASVVPGQIVAVQAQTLGLWTLNLSRITETVDTESRFGFIYATTAMHVEFGEERFLLEFDEETGSVWYEIEAVSRPRSLLARLGFPFTRAFQHRLARDSHRRMGDTVAAENS